MRLAILTIWICGAAYAQESLTLKEAVRQALAAHPSQDATSANVRAAEARVEQARAAYLPRATYSELFQSSNQPVFAFGSLLNQRQFTASNLALDALNHPGFVNNFRSQIGVEQTVWDFGATRAGVESAAIGREMAREQQRLTAQQRVATVAGAYHAVTLATEARNVAAAAVQSAEADLARAEAVRDAGMSTDADVLTVRVHLAAMREQEIRRRYDAETALAALNEAMGAPLDTVRQLDTPLVATDGIVTNGGDRPELQQARLNRELKESLRTAAAKAYLPRVVAQAAFEANRGRFITQGGANWFLGAGLEWSLFDGSTRRRVEEAEHARTGAAALERQVTAEVALQVRQARAAFASAQERMNVVEAAVAEAEESTRIVRNRYEAGLARIDELLRNELALMDAQMRRLAAVYDQRMAAVNLELAAGTLTEDSHVLD